MCYRLHVASTGPQGLKRLKQVIFRYDLRNVDLWVPEDLEDPLYLV